VDERNFEFLAEIPDGASIKVWGSYILISHPDHPLKQINPDGSIEIVEPWPAHPNSPTSAPGSK
jgi:hypothetical protein